MPKSALVTGGSRGIGAAAAYELSKFGYTVAVNYRENAAAAQSVCDRIISSGGYAKAYQADISIPEDIERMFAQTEAELGAADVLVNNAGISHIGLLHTIKSITK